MFFTLFAILTCNYVAVSTLEEDTKVKYFILIGVLVLLKIIFSILL